MVLTQNQIQEILDIIDVHQVKFLAEQVGSDILSSSDFDKLKEFGIDVDKLSKTGIVDNAFKFGVLSTSLEEAKLKKLSYDQFLKFMKEGKGIPLSKEERFALNNVKQRTYSDIKGLGNKISKDFQTILIESSQTQRKKYEKIIQETSARNIIDRGSISNMVSELGHKTNDWTRDFGRISDYVLHDAFDNGRLENIKSQFGGDAEVYKQVYPGACKYCINLYLTNGIGSEPIVFKVNDLIANGSNIGRKTSEWKAVCGCTHPFCFDDQTEVLTDQGWKFFKDLDTTEKFLSVDLETGNAEYLKAINYIGYYYSGYLDSFQSNNFDLVTTKNHRHVIHTSKIKKDRLIPGDLLPKNFSFLRSIPNWIGEDYLKGIKIGRSNFKTKDFFEFMGYYLSEGNISKTKKGQWQLKITQEKKDTYELMNNCIIQNFDKVWSGKDAIYILLKDKKIIDFFIKLGKSKQKTIPEVIKLGSKNLLNIFINAYIAGDGSVRERENKYLGYVSKEKVIYTSSIKMVSDLSEVILKLGLRPSFHEESEKIIKHHNGSYKSCRMFTVRICNNKYSTTNHIERKDVLYDGYVYDVELEKYNTLFVRRNNKVTLSGNCRCTIFRKPEGYKWDVESQSFSIP